MLNRKANGKNKIKTYLTEKNTSLAGKATLSKNIKASIVF